MEFEKSFEKLKSSAVFKKWKTGHKTAYLSSCFILLGDDVVNKELSNWQFDFCFNRKITSFVVGDEIDMREDDAFKEKETKIHELNLENVKLSLETAFKKAEKVDKNKSEKVQKKIIVLQNLGEGEIWNISMITDCFNLINVRVSASDGKIVSHDSYSLLKFKGG